MQKSEHFEVLSMPFNGADQSALSYVAEGDNIGDQKQVQLTNYQNFFFASRPIPQTAELTNGR